MLSFNDPVRGVALLGLTTPNVWDEQITCQDKVGFFAEADLAAPEPFLIRFFEAIAGIREGN